MIKKVLVAVDGSEYSHKAVGYASDIALKYDCQMYLINVVRKVEIPEQLIAYANIEKIEESHEYVFFEEIGKRILKKAEETAKKKGVKEVHSIINKGDPANRITEFARENDIDWIFLGTRGLGRIKGLLLGSGSNKVCNMADSTCVTVK
ncbi:MAG: hypothetical protein GQ544_06570 [Candidatus Aminicenantes bacterium]|nr:hypothetical protein [Candidatus Aminicenantes bacterium]